jgi:hypothetical protein
MGRTYWKCRLVLLAGAAATLLGSVATYSQTATPSTAAPAAPAPGPASAAASAASDRKKALEFGLRPRVVKGAAMYCKDEPIYGTPFKNTRCIPAEQIADYLVKLQAAHDALAKNGCGSNGLCGNVGAVPDRPRMGMGSAR